MTDNRSRGISAAEIAVGFAAAGLLFIFTPVLEMLEMFMWVVVLPLALFASVGLISDGTVRFIGEGFNDFLAQIKNARAVREPETVQTTKEPEIKVTQRKPRKNKKAEAESTEAPKGTRTLIKTPKTEQASQ